MSAFLQSRAQAASEYRDATANIIRYVASSGGASVDLAHDDAAVREMSDQTLYGLVSGVGETELEKRFGSSLGKGPPKNAAKWLEETGLPFWRELCRKNAALQELYRRSTDHGLNEVKR